MKHWVLAALLFLNGTLGATTWLVGPTRQYTAPSAVSGLVANGDTVNIDPGLYTGDVTKWFASNLVIRCLGPGYAHLEANGNYAEGKAIWVIKGANCTVEGIEFSGCKVPDHNGAGIRQEGQHLTLRNCYFHHNEMGILTSNDGVSDYVFESCEFAFNGFGDGYSHNVYVGSVNSLTMRYCYSHDSHVGHLVKSRARFNYLYYNRFTGENGDGSYEVDLPNGGRAYLIGNIIEQGLNSQNSGIISFAAENQNHPEQEIILAHNTILNNRPNGRFVQHSNGIDLVKMVNNLFLGGGTLLQGAATAVDTTHNLRITSIQAGQLNDPTMYDYSLTANSPCVNAGTQPGDYQGVSLAAVYSYLHPMSRTARWHTGSAPDVGAYEFLVSPYRSLPDEKAASILVYPNPAAAGELITISFDGPISKDLILYFQDQYGRVVCQISLNKSRSQAQLNLPNLPPGIYWMYAPVLGIKAKLVVK
ncbi:MAG: right-handed parallel beta-helix repeat-containing protein [Saprospiraceae bacterium]|nr:right-handed parallel beta-helix repeat-containing protein [Saprospiraceae bacterium]